MMPKGCYAFAQAAEDAGAGGHAIEHGLQEVCMARHTLIGLDNRQAACSSLAVMT